MKGYCAEPWSIIIWYLPKVGSMETCSPRKILSFSLFEIVFCIILHHADTCIDYSSCKECKDITNYIAPHVVCACTSAKVYVMYCTWSSDRVQFLRMSSVYVYYEPVIFTCALFMTLLLMTNFRYKELRHLVLTRFQLVYSTVC